jgi:hypothetical protein
LQNVSTFIKVILGIIKIESLSTDPLQGLDVGLYQLSPRVCQVPSAMESADLGHLSQVSI